MPRYWPLRRVRNEAERTRTIDGILRLRKALQKDIGEHRKPGSLLLATWNIRELGNNRKMGRRLRESFHYIAEVISQFHLVALQEVNRDLDDFEEIMHLLGPNWKCMLTDVTEGVGGNGERMAFVYDSRFVSFRNVAGEIVLPVGQRVDKTPEDEDALQFARTPFMVAFQADWLKFNLCTVHIYFGDDSGQKLKRRIDEIKKIAKFFEKRQKKEKGDYIILGDFNIVSPEHETMQALTASGFEIPENLLREKTNLKGDKHYDQIALKPQEKQLEIGASGVFNFDRHVFRTRDERVYSEAGLIHKSDGLSGSELTKQYKTWRTYQMSDHLPMWVELKIDFTEPYLESLRPGHDPLAEA